MSVREDLAVHLQDLSRSGWGDAARRPLLNDIAGLLAFEAAFYFSYRYGVLFTQTSQSSASPFWFPDSILLCALLLVRPEKWWIYLVAPLPIRLFSDVAQGIPMWFLLGTYALDSLKGLAAAFALRRFLRNPLRIETLQDFGIFCAIAVLVVPGLSALAGAALRGNIGINYWPAWEQWFLGDAITQLVVTPAILGLITGGLNRLRVLDGSRRIEAAVMLGGLILTGYIAGQTGPSSAMLSEPRFYAPMLFLFWAAIRFGVFGACISVPIWAFLFASGAVEGRGPFSGLSSHDTAIALQAFLFPRALVVYVVALSIDQIRRAQDLLRESEQRFRNMANDAPVLIWMSGRDKLCDFFNQSWLEFTGRTMEAEMGNGWA